MRSNIEKDILAMQKNDMSVFDHFYHATYKSVFYIIFSILKDYQASEDIAQETYIKIIEKIDTYTSGTNAFAWVLQISKNLALNEKVRKSKIIEIDPSIKDFAFGSYTMNTNLQTPIIDLAIHNLSEEDFQIVSLIAISGYKRREVSEIMQMPIGTITWRYNEALKKLKKIILEKGGNENEQ